jgi:hypothetical protein
MAADLFVRILFKSNEFDKSINQSRTSVNRFGKDIDGTNLGLDVLSSGFKKTATLVAKYAASLGVAMTAGESFMKVIRSSQTTSDEFDNTLNAAKGTVDAFFTSISTGNWGAFNDGVLTAFNRLKDLSAVMDSIADKRLSYTYIKADELNNMEKYETIAKDINYTYEERKKAAEAMQVAVKKLSKETQDLANAEMDALRDRYNAQYGIDVTNEDLDYFFRHTNKGDKEALQAIEEYKKGLNQIIQENTIVMSGNSIAGGYSGNQLSKTGQMLKAQYERENEEVRKQLILLEEVDERRKETLDTLIKGFETKAYVESLQRRADETMRSVTPVQVKVDAEKFKEDIKKETNKLSLIIPVMPSLYTSSSTRGGNEKVRGDIESGYIQSPTLFTSANIQANYEYADSLSSIGSVLSTVSGLANEGAAAWITYGANIVQSIAGAIPSIKALTNANAMAAASEAAKNSAALGPLGWVMAGVAVASIIAAMLSVPKFATGGIVPGNMYAGDNMLIRANSGEMILNRTQQGNLFRMLQNGGSNSDFHAKLTIDGDKLAVLIDKVNKKKNRLK